MPSLPMLLINHFDGSTINGYTFLEFIDSEIASIRRDIDGLIFNVNRNRVYFQAEPYMRPV